MHPSTRFVRGEIVSWVSLSSNREHRGVVRCQYDDPLLGDRVLVRGAPRYNELIRADRLSRASCDGPVFAGPGALA